MILNDFITLFEKYAPIGLQESYDNSGVQIGLREMEIKGVLTTIDVTEEVINEAIENGCNLIISHHPLIFKPLKRITSDDLVQRCILSLIQNNIALYVAHTNFDNILEGVNGKIADKIGLVNQRVLKPLSNQLIKLQVYVPVLHAVAVRDNLFAAGAGAIGNYEDCSFSISGHGTFRANENANPFVGEKNKLHIESEIKLEVIFQSFQKTSILKALHESHPYEEPAYDLIVLENESARLGAGLIGELPDSEDEENFLNKIKTEFGCQYIRHTKFTGKKIKKVAICGGSGSFLLSQAVKSGADVFISGDFKYHEFFEADNRILIADLGHFETEQFTKHIFYEIIRKKMPTFVVRISETKTNPINYL